MKFSFLGRGQESPAVQLYGKLPVAKDYLRVGCGESSGRELREWLDRTFGSARGVEDELELPEPLCFLGQGTDDPLQGCLWPSSDEGEHRKFPFTIFVERKAKALLADLEQGNLAEAEAVWRELSETRERCLAASDGRVLLDQQRGRELELASLEKVPGAGADFDAWVAALWPDEQVDGLNRVFGELQALARSSHVGPYRLPLVRDLPLRDQVIGWTGVLRELGALAEAEVPTLFFPPRALVSSSAPASLVVSRRRLDDAHVAWLTEPSGAGALGRADLSQEEGPSEGLFSAPEATKRLRVALGEALSAYRQRGA